MKEMILRYAHFDVDRKYRYLLRRSWPTGFFDPSNDDYVMFVGLNPSTADENDDDPTIRKSIGFTKRLGYKKMYMCNLFAFRATNPKELLNQDDPIGPENNQIILSCAHKAKVIIATWGSHKLATLRAMEIVKLLEGHKIYCFGKNKDGQPKHLLYLHYESQLSELR